MNLRKNKPSRKTVAILLVIIVVLLFITQSIHFFAPDFELPFDINLAYLIALLVLVVASILAYLLATRLSGVQDRIFTKQWWAETLYSLSRDLMSAVFTAALLGLFLTIAQQNQEKNQRKTELIHQMGSSQNSVAIQAVEELSAEGWLTDGTLRGVQFEASWMPNLDNAHLMGADLRETYFGVAHFRGANLGVADLSGAQLPAADFQGAYLQGAKFENAALSIANLQDAFMEGVNLHGTHLVGVNLKGATGLTDTQLVLANSLRYSMMPDGQIYNGRFDLPGDLDMAQSTGIDLNDPADMAKYYHISIYDYQQGQIWARHQLDQLRKDAEEWYRNWVPGIG